jgi:pimeloyl-ACP methyl ester carboxylesterase
MKVILNSARALAPLIMVVVGLAAIPNCADAQSFDHLQQPSALLTIKALGSFYVGGRSVSQNANQLGLYGGGPIFIDQMYVQYLIPTGSTKASVVMIHGATLSGKSYETTPDGRMGWYEYFARKGFSSYVVDQVGRGRSGFNQAPFNDVRAGVAPPDSQPVLRRVASDRAWVRFRAGPSPGVKFDDSQFPVESADEFAKQAVPDLPSSLPPNDTPHDTKSQDDANYAALSELSRELKNTVLLGHSQAGRFPFETALLDQRGITALVAIEPPGCNATSYSNEQIAKLARLPILVVFGDHLDTPQSVGPNWNPFFKDCEDFVSRINAAKGQAKMLHPADIGIHGNSHMMMQDRNNIRIADLIANWIESVSARH